MHSLDREYKKNVCCLKEDVFHILGIHDKESSFSRREEVEKHEVM